MERERVSWLVSKLVVKRPRWKLSYEQKDELQKVIDCIAELVNSNLGTETIITTRKVYAWMNGIKDRGKSWYQIEVDLNRNRLIALSLTILAHYGYLKCVGDLRKGE